MCSRVLPDFLPRLWIAEGSKVRVDELCLTTNDLFVVIFRILFLRLHLFLL